MARLDHIHLPTLVERTGVSLRQRDDDEWQGPHPQKHESKSGTCLLITKKRYWCSSCKERGDAADWLVDVGWAPDRASATAILVGMYGAANGMAQLQITTMRDVTPSRVEWLWGGRLPRAKLIVVAGDPGVAKSYLTLSMASILSVGGVWPDGNAAPLSNVLIVSAEDGLADTIRPRLDLLDADLGRIHHINTVLREGEKEVGLSLSDHLFQLEGAIVEYHADLVILDPILAFMGKKADTHKSSDVRAVLAPIGSMAERTGCAFLAVLHLNKRSTEGSSIYRLMASLDFAAAARAVFIVGRNPDDSDQRVFAAVKTNLSAMPSSLGFHFEQGLFTWDGVVDLDANAVLSTRVLEKDQEPTAVAEAEHFLMTLLSNERMEGAEIIKEAKGNGIKETTLRRAKNNIGVESEREGIKGKRGQGVWYWKLPPQFGAAAPLDLDGQPVRVGGDDHLNQIEHVNDNVSREDTNHTLYGDNPPNIEQQGAINGNTLADDLDGQPGGVGGDDHLNPTTEHRLTSDEIAPYQTQMTTIADEQSDESERASPPDLDGQLQTPRNDHLNPGGAVTPEGPKNFQYITGVDEAREAIIRLTEGC